MKSLIAALSAGLIAACATAPGPARAAAPPPLEAYGKLPTIEDVVISPDGARLATIVTDGENRIILVVTSDGLKPVARLNAGTTKVRWLQWAGSDHLIVTVSKDTWVPDLEGGKREWFLAVDFDLATHKGHPLLQDIQHDPSDPAGSENMNTVFGRPMIRTVKGRLSIFVEGMHFIDSKGMNSLFSYDPKSGESRLIQTGYEDAADWLVDQAGEVLAMDEYDGQARRWTLRAMRHGGLAKIKSVTEGIEFPSIEGLGRDGNSVLISAWNSHAADGDVRADLVELAPGGNDWGKPVVEGGADEELFDSATDAWIGTHDLDGDADHYKFFDAHDQALWDSAVRAYKGSRVSLASMSGDHRKLVVLVDSPIDGQAYALVDLDTHKGTWLGGLYDAASDDLGLQTPVAFKAADGFDLTGYLTIPKGADAKNLPLVVFPHGGPASRDEPGFDWWAQAMASRGYAVLQVNFRGSGGFGWDYLKAGFGQYGRKMQTDLSDGVRWLAAQGKIDPKRICIVGASYGGYAALAGATLDAGVYRCAVSVAGISDLRRMVSWEDTEKGADTKRYWLRFMGVDRAGDPRLDEISPIKHIDKVRIPILLIHGKDDTVVDIGQSQAMYDALRKAGKDTELVVLPHENHHLLTGATRLQMLQATMAFLLKNNPPG